ncbi:MAG: hypothetical protein Q7R95_06080 [bacterium]|nr:hypothetical protein [bacterium]
MNKIYETLYKRTVKGQIQEWTIIATSEGFYVREGIVGMKITETKLNRCEPKNIGKSNETDSKSQAILEAQAKFDKKLKTGYKLDVKDIDNNSYIAPMKAKKFRDYQEDITYPVAIEDKLNGICCTVDKRGGLSYKGEQFYCINHILEEAAHLIEKYPNIYLHGELFNYEYRNLLNRIASLVSVNRKEKDISPEDEKESEKLVKLYVYDFYGTDKVTKDTSYIDRKKVLKELLKNNKYIIYLDYKLANSLEDVEKALKETKENQWEGIMVKLLNGKYSHKRSKEILKLKNWSDEEFEILGFEEGEGNWQNCCKGVICKLNKLATNGKTTFTSNIRGTQEELANLWKTQKEHLNKFCTVDFQEKSEFGIPLIPYTQLPFRDYE